MLGTNTAVRSVMMQTIPVAIYHEIKHGSKLASVLCASLFYVSAKGTKRNT
jgi:hypothetical protein